MKTTFRLIISAYLLLTAGYSFALEITPYTPDAFTAAQKAGKPVAVHFHADWCPTCRVQDKILSDLKADASLPVTVYVINYDQDLEARKTFRVASQSTLLIFHGTKQTSRSAFETDPAKLRAALKSAL